ncbi:hypothetical protein NTGM5_120098 [Candidatus Nitrotoga sp. M5]|nr:hypothetical protein NTGM5_120098 [Candidatus Nitrotoga sp. M5]
MLYVHRLGAIDFENDSISARSLAQTQIRNQLPYFFSATLYFDNRLPMLFCVTEFLLY